MRRAALTCLYVAVSVVTLAFLAFPIAAIFAHTSPGHLLDQLSNPVVRDAFVVSLKTSVLAQLLILLFGTPTAYLLATNRFPGHSLAITIVELPLVLPPAVAGVGLLVAFGHVGLLGSSLGGFVALHVAARRRGLPVVTWNAPASLTELANDDLQEARGLGVPFALEYATGRYALAPVGVERHLVIHGESDEVVGVEHGAALHERAAEPCELVLIPGGDHRLTDPAHRKHAVATSRDWLLRFLS